MRDEAKNEECSADSELELEFVDLEERVMPIEVHGACLCSSSCDCSSCSCVGIAYASAA